MTTFFKAEQVEKTEPLISLTEEGMTTLSNLVQQAKQLSQRRSTVFDIVKYSKDVQL